MNEKEIRYIDLFGGIGGFRLGLEKANELVERTTDKKAQSSKQKSESRRGEWEYATYKCVWYCDKDKYSCQTYNKNFKTQYEPTDITTIKPSDIPDFDMLCAGFPCQSFSIAGKRKGFQDIRGTMFFQIYRIASEKKPRLLFLENVKGLLSADDGRCFSTILSSLQKLGYSCEWQVLNSKNYGVPQNRERVFIIGHLRGTGGREIFPLRQDCCEDNGEEGCTSRHKVEEWYQGRGKGNVPRSRRQGEQDDNTSRGELQSDDTRCGAFRSYPRIEGRKENPEQQRSQRLEMRDDGVSNTLSGVEKDNVIVKVGDMNGNGWEKRHESSRRVYDSEGISPTIPTKTGGGHLPKIIDKAGKAKNRDVASTLTGGGHSGGNHSDMDLIMLNLQNAVRTGEWGDGTRKDGLSFTLQGSSGNDYCVMNTLTEATGNRAGSSKESLRTVDNINKTTGQIRRLTPVECERLQGFPDNWTEGVSDTQRYKQLGNAVTVNVIQAIGMRILDCV